nr:unnamed protein product [Digitaria exilis]
MDQLEVVGTGLDFICLVQCLRKKIGYADLLKVEEVKARDTRAVVVNTQGAQPAYYEPANNDPTTVVTAASTCRAYGQPAAA